MGSKDPHPHMFVGSHIDVYRNKRPPHSYPSLKNPSIGTIFYTFLYKNIGNGCTFRIQTYTILYMTKQIQVSDEVHARLKAEADDNYRSIGGQIEFMMDNQASHPVPAKEIIRANRQDRDLPDIFQEPKLVREEEI